MAISNTPSKKPAATSDKKSSRKPPTDALDASDTVDQRIREFVKARRRRRQLQALKLTCYAMATAFLCSVGCAVWQLTIPSLFAGVYATLAGVFAAATGVGYSIYLSRRRNE
ncbi:hypothetical protein ACFV6E_13470 [Streptomyces sp. NPDC059785]|uniref:hypothetical protein n=1 Tax=unclassified Streptomyces TaxID=2593676 RepID=UPI00364D4D24